MTNNNQTEMFKNCPFCPDGGDTYLHKVGNAHTKERGADVGCVKCGFKNSIRVARYTIDWAVDTALTAWNTRATDSRDEVIKVLREALRKAIADREARHSEGKYGYSLLTDELTEALTRAEQLLNKGDR